MPNISYLFEINKEQEELDLDSMFYGNKMRFINHHLKNCNVVCKDVVVCGHGRIKVTASANIRPGEELFMNYGENYSAQYLQVMTGVKSVTLASSVKTINERKLRLHLKNSHCEDDQRDDDDDDEEEEEEVDDDDDNEDDDDDDDDDYDNNGGTQRLRKRNSNGKNSAKRKHRRKLSDDSQMIILDEDEDESEHKRLRSKRSRRSD